MLRVSCFTKKVMTKRRSSVFTHGEAADNNFDWTDNESESDVNDMPLVSDFEDEVNSNEGVDTEENNKDDIPGRPTKKLLTKKEDSFMI